MECEHDDEKTLFCGKCGKVREPNSLKSVRLMSFVGVQQSTSPKIEAFWRSGDPDDLL